MEEENSTGASGVKIIIFHLMLDFFASPSSPLRSIETGESTFRAPDIK